MIDRFVFVKLQDPVLRDTVAAAARSELPRVPGVVAARVGVPADAAAEVWDLVLVVSFERYEDVATYLDHPIHVAFVQQHLAPHVEVKKAWNFGMS